MKVKLIKTNSEWRELSPYEQQQATVIGDAPSMPKIGEPFCIYSANGNVKTSRVTELLPGGRFRTINSIYKIEQL